MLESRWSDTCGKNVLYLSRKWPVHVKAHRFRFNLTLLDSCITDSDENFEDRSHVQVNAHAMN